MLVLEKSDTAVIQLGELNVEKETKKITADMPIGKGT